VGQPANAPELVQGGQRGLPVRSADIGVRDAHLRWGGSHVVVGVEGRGDGGGLRGEQLLGEVLADPRRAVGDHPGVARPGQSLGRRQEGSPVVHRVQATAITQVVLELVLDLPVGDGREGPTQSLEARGDGFGVIEEARLVLPSEGAHGDGKHDEPVGLGLAEHGSVVAPVARGRRLASAKPSPGVVAGPVDAQRLEGGPGGAVVGVHADG